MAEHKKQPSKTPNSYRELCWVGCDARVCVCYQECRRTSDGTPMLYRDVAKELMSHLRVFPLRKEKFTPVVEEWYTSTYKTPPTRGQVAGIMSANGNLLASQNAYKRKRIKAKLTQPSLFSVV